MPALEKGCDSIGFSEHSYVPFDILYSMTIDNTYSYMREVNALKDKYEGVVEVFLGLEQDYYAESIPDGFDYIIGSLHYVNVGGKYFSVDAGASQQVQLVNEHYGGDYYAMAEDYFSVLANIIKKTGADIVGHFDLVTKYNHNSCYFDQTHPRYVEAAISSMDEILKDCKLFEVNTGAMCRVNKTEPYPSFFLLKELYLRGGEVILTSDSHDAGSICYLFGEMQELLKTCGFKYLKRLTKSGFVDIKL